MGGVVVVGLDEKVAGARSPPPIYDS